MKLFRLRICRRQLCFGERYRMRQRARASILNLIACIAAFALVALISIFGHPAAQPDPAATVTANAASSVQANSVLTPASGSLALDRASR